MYDKHFTALQDDMVRSVLAERKYPICDKERWLAFLKAVNYDRVLAMLEFPFVDIELEMWSVDGDFDCASTDDRVLLGYVVCTRGEYFSKGRYDWMTDDFASDEPNVDFSAPNWEELLETDMLKVLDKYVREHRLSYTEPND